MGKWADSEYDRLAVAKLQRLFDIATAKTEIQGSPGPKTLRTFIKELDPSDKAVQACFTTLVKRHFHNKSRLDVRARVLLTTRHNPSDGLADRPRSTSDSTWELFEDSRESPPRIPTDLIESLLPTEGPVNDLDPDLRHESGEQHEQAPGGDSAHSSRAPRPRAVPTYSPYRRAQSEVAPNLTRSPPSPSRAWLDEYQAMHSVYTRPAPSYRQLFPTRSRTHGREEESEEERHVRPRYDHDAAGDVSGAGARRPRSGTTLPSRRRRLGTARDTRRDGVVLELPDDSPWQLLDLEAEPFLPLLPGQSDAVPNRVDETIDFMGNPPSAYDGGEGDPFQEWRY